MEYEVSYRGTPVGQVEVVQQAKGVQFTAHCIVPTAAVLRLYGQTTGEPLRIGVLEPFEDRLSITRLLSADALRQSGCGEQLPQIYYLDDGSPETAAYQQAPLEETPPLPEETVTSAPPPVQTVDDPLLDPLLESGQVTISEEEDCWRLSCAFDDSENPLAFAMTACTVADGRAVLQLRRTP